MNDYVGLDVSLAQTAICVVDDDGKPLWRLEPGPVVLAERFVAADALAGEQALDAVDVPNPLPQQGGALARGAPPVLLRRRGCHNHGVDARLPGSPGQQRPEQRLAVDGVGLRPPLPPWRGDRSRIDDVALDTSASSSRCTQKPSLPASWMTTTSAFLPADCSTLPRRRASRAAPSPAATECFDIVRLPGASDVTSQVDRLPPCEALQRCPRKRGKIRRRLR